MSAKAGERMIIPRTGISQGTSLPRGLYGPLVNRLADALGEKDTNRASHVDSVNDLTDAARNWLWRNYTGPVTSTQVAMATVVYPKNKWFADLLPVDGPVLGPFDTREDGLAAERDWLHEHNIPVPGQTPEMGENLTQRPMPLKCRQSHDSYDFNKASDRVAWLRDYIWDGSQVTMAKETGVNQATLSNVLRGKRGVGRALLEKIGRHPHVNEVWLLVGGEEPRALPS